MGLNEGLEFLHCEPVVSFSVDYSVAVGADKGKIVGCDSAGLGQGVEREFVVDFYEAFATVAVFLGEIKGAGFAFQASAVFVLCLLFLSFYQCTVALATDMQLRQYAAFPRFRYFVICVGFQ